MKIPFRKYQAAGNDFLVIERTRIRVPAARIPKLALAICNRRTGVGADGLLVIGASARADCKLDVYNADGGWAEKSGNGLRITGVHLAATRKGSRTRLVETGAGVNMVRLLRRISDGRVVCTELGQPTFKAAAVPVRTRRRFLINSPLKLGKINLPITCLAIGNPHAVVLVSDFDFDWPSLGSDIETAKAFPNGTNVEFVQVQSRRKLLVAEWERGAGATGSSGTGAAAAVSAMVMLGLVDRICEVEFELGTLLVNWREADDVVEVTGPVQLVMEGVYEFL